jgi:hypothetical protein
MTLNHPIFTRWPAQYSDRLQLFSAPTPNGVKVGIMLEETNLAYEPHRIDITADESYDTAFLALNPNGKIPAIYDLDGLSGTPLALFESGAILLYLADKTGQFTLPIYLCRSEHPLRNDPVGDVADGRSRAACVPRLRLRVRVARLRRHRGGRGVRFGLKARAIKTERYGA